MDKITKVKIRQEWIWGPGQFRSDTPDFAEMLKWWNRLKFSVY
jgi:hypothetical protein